MNALMEEWMETRAARYGVVRRGAAKGISSCRLRESLDLDPVGAVGLGWALAQVCTLVSRALRRSRLVEGQPRC